MASQGGSIFCLHDRSQPELKTVTKQSLLDDAPIETTAYVSICYKCGRKWFAEV